MTGVQTCALPISTVNKVLTVFLLWFGAREVMQGHLTVGQLIAFNMLSSRAVAPILRLSQIWKEFQQVKVSIARIADIFKAPAEPGFNPEKVDLPPIRGALEFDHVTFRYRPDGPVILDDISFSVQCAGVAHQPDEYTEIDYIVNNAKVFASMMLGGL